MNLISESVAQSSSQKAKVALSGRSSGVAKTFTRADSRVAKQAGRGMRPHAPTVGPRGLREVGLIGEIAHQRPPSAETTRRFRELTPLGRRHASTGAIVFLDAEMVAYPRVPRPNGACDVVLRICVRRVAPYSLRLEDRRHSSECCLHTTHGSLPITGAVRWHLRLSERARRLTGPAAKRSVEGRGLGVLEEKRHVGDAQSAIQ